MALTPFDPRTDGFVFINNWSFDAVLDEQIRKAMSDCVSGVTGFLISVPAFAPFRPFVLRTIDGWVNRATTRAYGMCGGMAFAALDYYLCNRSLPPDQGPTDRLSPELRDYIFRRMKDSFLFVQDGAVHNNLARVLAWMAVEHLTPFGRGRPLLLDLTKAELPKLADRINQNGAWPVALIGESQDPSLNHQVLAYRCDIRSDRSDIYVYDMNHPGTGRKISLDLRGPGLIGVGEFANDTWQPLRGFFCEDYAPAIPPS